MRRPFALNAVERLRAHLREHPPTAAAEPERLLAAVALIVVPDPDAILVIQRAASPDDPWSGHMGLPGGKRESGDPDLVATAIRETREELGITIDHSMLVSPLDDVFPRTKVTSPFLVRPFLFAAPTRQVLVPSEEVASAEWLPVARLTDPATYQTVTLTVAGMERVVPGYVLDPERVIWGMTERVLTPLVEALRRA
ncbi:MAG TPA: CoA pyrophosphatase [Gemmatimonadales bacterium]|nr:CoA pyrophosphatase [Gemmatimonadales bacterium]